MSIDWRGSFELEGLRQRAHAGIEAGLLDGGRMLLKASEELVPKAPKEPGDSNPHLAATGKVRTGRGGANTVAITYAGPYARYIHEHLGFKHPHGGQAKFLELALLIKGGDALNKIADRVQESL